MAKLTDIIAKAKAGKVDHVVFSFSSHGTQVPDQNGDEAVDHVDEAFACYDIAQKDADWDRDTVIVDDELHALLSGHPEERPGRGVPRHLQRHRPEGPARPEGAVPAAAHASRYAAARREVRPKGLQELVKAAGRDPRRPLHELQGGPDIGRTRTSTAATAARSRTTSSRPWPRTARQPAALLTASARACRPATSPSAPSWRPRPRPRRPRSGSSRRGS